MLNVRCVDVYACLCWNACVPACVCVCVCVCRISIGGPSSPPQCLTCTLHEDRCQYNSVSFSPDASFFRLDCNGPSPTLNTSQACSSLLSCHRSSMLTPGLLSTQLAPANKQSLTHTSLTIPHVCFLNVIIHRSRSSSTHSDRQPRQSSRWVD